MNVRLMPSTVELCNQYNAAQATTMDIYATTKAKQQAYKEMDELAKKIALDITLCVQVRQELNSKRTAA